MSGGAGVFLYKSDPVRGATWAALFAAKAPELEFVQWPYDGDPAAVRYMAAWEPPVDLSRYTSLEILFSVGAGIDHIDFSRVPAQLPVVRMVEAGIVGGMVEYLTLAVLAIHRHWQAYNAQQRACTWRPIAVAPASTRRIGVLGLGVLSQAALAQLRSLGFPCAGWSRSQHDLDGIDCFDGEEGLSHLLARTDVLICLLPLTAATKGILNAALFARLPRGAALINAGRGGHLVEADLLDALDSGQLASAVLDVCEPEPLPADHAFWRHPAITLTPHIASMTQPDTAVEAVLENLRRHRAGEPLTGLVERERGY